MLLASYSSTRPGLQGVANWAIRKRLHGVYSHSEVVFMPGDGVDHLMPDGTCEPVDGAYWAASSVAAEKLPEHSPRRAGRTGGVRFKRIKFDPAHWELLEYRRDPVYAAQVFKKHIGEPYDWQLIASSLVWVITQKESRKHCGEICALAGGIPSKDAWRFDPCALRAMVYSENLKELYV